jgi:hypothetical protein
MRAALILVVAMGCGNATEEARMQADANVQDAVIPQDAPLECGAANEREVLAVSAAMPGHEAPQGYYLPDGSIYQVPNAMTIEQRVALIWASWCARLSGRMQPNAWTYAQVQAIVEGA